ncbi:hypothetical protein BST97_09650 [Nonlabens spongiae]|uniref:Uncharacterized protein n=1 Tax=Nonlabens spongiae TaxID=331648 RepID=A0A1W6MKU1_9FLAO|nr:hypothetical protein [Nonlabens spongiae]ARN78234.1 hypothetical protein BST97_09650 [Nonlabens spongiae]
MSQIIGILFISGVVIALILEDKKSSKKFYEDRIEDLKNELSNKKNSILRLEKQLSQLSILDTQPNFGYTSEDEYNDAIDELEKNMKSNSILETIYHDVDLPDQLFYVSIREKTQTLLSKLEQTGIHHKDQRFSEDLVDAREKITGQLMNLELFIRDYIQQNSVRLAKEKYLGLVKIFEISGRDVADSKSLYSELFL